MDKHLETLKTAYLKIADARRVVLVSQTRLERTARTARGKGTGVAAFMALREVVSIARDLEGSWESLRTGCNDILGVIAQMANELDVLNATAASLEPAISDPADDSLLEDLEAELKAK